MQEPSQLHRRSKVPRLGLHKRRRCVSAHSDPATFMRHDNCYELWCFHPHTHSRRQGCFSYVMNAKKKKNDLREVKHCIHGQAPLHKKAKIFDPHIQQLFHFRDWEANKPSASTLKFPFVWASDWLILADAPSAQIKLEVRQTTGLGRERSMLAKCFEFFFLLFCNVELICLLGARYG